MIEAPRRMVVGGLLMVSFGGPAAGQETAPPGVPVAVVRATRAAERITIDGRLDENDWHRAAAARGFRQVDPVQNAAATFDTEVRVLFDDRHLYVGAWARDSIGRAGVRVVDLDRDFDFFNNDLFGITLDPFLDRRNSVSFQTNPYGAQRDLLAFDGAVFDRDWTGVWRVRTTITDSGWVAEFAIPWATLRYPRERVRGWGVNFVRIVRRLNEQTGWQPWPRALNNYTMTYAGLLEGLEPPPPGRNVRFQPYLTGRIQRTSLAGRTTTTGDPEIGGDLKWAVAPNTVADFTINTDFAEADVDRQVVNLTRFSTFFPERRQFFLESAALFETGRDRGNLRPFYSRRIGLNPNGAPIPIDAGARVIHRSVDRAVGLLAIRQRASGGLGASTFGVFRLSENVGRGHRLGVEVVHREDEAGTGTSAGSNTVAVADGFLRSGASVLRAAVSGSVSSGSGGDGVAGYLWIYANKPFGYFGWIQEYVEREYRAAAGFVGRQNYIWTSPATTLDLRPAWKPRFIRKFDPGVSTSFYHDADNREFREGSVGIAPIAAEFNSGAELRLFWRPVWQRLERTFSPVPGIDLPTGRYRFSQFGVTWQPNLSRPYWAYVTLVAGTFFDGTHQQVTYRASPLPGPKLRLTVDYEGNRFRHVSPAQVDRTTHLLSVLVRYTPTPVLGVSAFYEYNSTTRLGVWNARLSWEFLPLSFLYVVYNDRQPQDESGLPATRPTERQLLIKVTLLAQL